MLWHIVSKIGMYNLLIHFKEQFWIFIYLSKYGLTKVDALISLIPFSQKITSIA